MACGCSKGRAGRTADVKYRLTLPAGSTFTDGTSRKTYDTLKEAREARTEHGGGSIRPIT
jgi:hypothetical protein